MPVPPSQTIFQLRIALDDVTPTVWRRLLIPGSIRLAKLHNIFQAAMGWTNSHLHNFTIGDQLYGMNFDDYPEDEIDEKTVTMISALHGQKSFAYEYDFGDSWSHTVLVEDILKTSHGLKYAVCLAGENACPPEDCGGVGGYELLLDALADSKHEEHDWFLQWVGGSFDPTSFHLANVNVVLQKVR